MRQDTPLLPTLLSLSLLLFLPPALTAAEDGRAVQLRLGQFEPDGQSLWHEIADSVYSGNAEDLRGSAVGLDLRYPVLRWLSFFSSITDFSGDTTRGSLPGPEPDPGSSTHRWSLDTTSVTAGVILDPWRGRTVSPYAGAGAGVLSWEMSNTGALLILDDTGLPNLVFEGDYRTKNDTTVSYVQAGVDVRVSDRWSLFGEARWTQAEDTARIPISCLCIEEADLDLGGQELSAGLALHF